MTLSLAPQADGAIEGLIEYDADLFDEGSVRQWGEALGCVLEGMTRDAAAPVGSLALSSAHARAARLARSAGPVVELDGPLTVAGLFEAQVARTPQAVALVCEGETLTYAQLEARANRLARHLVGRGIGPEDIVAILLERSEHLVVGLLAVLKAGAAYLPLDADYPAQRLSYMLDDSRAKLLITSTRLAGLLDAGQPALVLDEAALQAQLAREPARALTDAERVRALSPANLAYLIYTSGSTGKPKACGNDA